ncbi:HTH-type transcriptional regulator AcrR [Myxococcaceae bacterium]|jgi:AcrR family transcriptional regulator|nr:HTH-type transcriptional regulator AcrR [Myxococcaceae bacterium]
MPEPRNDPHRERILTPQGASSRERILDAAIELISERGYSATSVDALCRRAGIVKTALYWHFGSKEGLLAAVIDRVASEWIDEIERSVYRVGEPVERLTRAVRGMRTLVEERPELLRLLLAVLFERAEGDTESRAALRRTFVRARRAIVDAIESSAPGVREPDLIAHTILSLMQGALLRRLVDPEGADLDRIFNEAERTVRLMLADRGIRDASPSDT